MNEIGGKNLLRITQLILFLTGSAVGILAVWQFFNSYPGVVKSAALRSVFYAASAVLPAVSLMLSAKPVLSILKRSAGFFVKKIRSAETVRVTSLIIGILIGALIGYLIDFLFRLFMPILAIRVFMDVVAGAATGYTGFLISAYFIGGAAAAPVTEAEQAKPKGFAAKFIFTSGALSSDIICELCKSSWLEGERLILRKSVNRLIDEIEEQGAAEALKNYKILHDGGLIKVIEEDRNWPEVRHVAAVAKKTGCRIVALTKDEVSGAADVPALILSEIDTAFLKLNENKNTGGGGCA